MALHFKRRTRDRRLTLLTGLALTLSAAVAAAPCSQPRISHRVGQLHAGVAGGPAWRLSRAGGALRASEERGGGSREEAPPASRGPPLGETRGWLRGTAVAAALALAAPLGPSAVDAMLQPPPFERHAAPAASYGAAARKPARLETLSTAIESSSLVNSIAVRIANNAVGYPDGVTSGPDKGPDLLPTLPVGKPLEAMRERRLLPGGLFELVVDARDGFEYLELAAQVTDVVPGSLKANLQRWREPVRRIDDYQIFVSGFVAGAVTEVAKVAVLHPLDTARTRITWARHRHIRRTVPKHKRTHRRAPVTVLDAPVTVPDGSARVGTKDGGAPALPRARTPWAEALHDPFAGLVPAILTAAPQGGIFFATYDVIRAHLSDKGLGDVGCALVAVLCAEIAYWAVRSPFEALKLLRQAEAVVDAEVHGSVKQTSWWPSDKQALLLGLQSYPASVVTYLPLTLLRVGAYRSWRSHQLDDTVTGALPLGKDILVTVAFSTAAALLTAPLELVRTRTLQKWIDERRKAVAADRRSAALVAAAVAPSPAPGALLLAGRVEGGGVRFASGLAVGLPPATGLAVGLSASVATVGVAEIATSEIIISAEDTLPDSRDLPDSQNLPDSRNLPDSLAVEVATVDAEISSLAPPRSISAIYWSVVAEVLQSRSTRSLYAGALSRASWIGLCFGLVTPFRLIAYGWLRDELILTWFDGRALGTIHLG
ncbi:hypothetical protein T492DRAFT_989596 [Pavlovales sp. CCMP2436]|nr:hypothetical protein T492DRAFT_989596 [Pavlovales sp. CCMP2436]|mmetsp:Transcript_22014/g.51172  ORF Transcript_22014/g.51172 Transcript_22014/m.51172 type:complete len:713 (-) Transcript_22014:198-2336(-)